MFRLKQEGHFHLNLEQSLSPTLPLQLSVSVTGGCSCNFSASGWIQVPGLDVTRSSSSAWVSSIYYGGVTFTNHTFRPVLQHTLPIHASGETLSARLHCPACFFLFWGSLGIKTCTLCTVTATNSDSSRAAGATSLPYIFSF